jgi:hypothetical protein
LTSLPDILEKTEKRISIWPACWFYLDEGVRTKKTNNFIFGEIIHLLTGVLAVSRLFSCLKRQVKTTI